MSIRKRNVLCQGRKEGGGRGRKGGKDRKGEGRQRVPLSVGPQKKEHVTIPYITREVFS